MEYRLALSVHGYLLSYGCWVDVFKIFCSSWLGGDQKNTRASLALFFPRINFFVTITMQCDLSICLDFSGGLRVCFVLLYISSACPPGFVNKNFARVLGGH